MDGGIGHTLPARGWSRMSEYQRLLCRLAILYLNYIQHLPWAPRAEPHQHSHRRREPRYRACIHVQPVDHLPQTVSIITAIYGDRGFDSLDIQRRQFSFSNLDGCHGSHSLVRSFIFIVD